MTAKLQLRPYQNEAVEAVFGSWQAGYKAPLIVIPTGGGKTIVFGEVARRMLPSRTLVVAHRQEFIHQAVDKSQRVTGIRPGIEMAGQRAAAEDRIVVATVQTLARGRRIAGAPFDLAVIDEAHHCLGDNQYGSAIEASGASRLVGGRQPLIGRTSGRLPRFLTTPPSAWACSI
jgi:superfamily II DNA or RNA helicase